MMGTGKSIRIVKKGDDVDENLSYYLSLSFGDRLKHLEELRTRYTQCVMIWPIEPNQLFGILRSSKTSILVHTDQYVQKMYE